MTLGQRVGVVLSGGGAIGFAHIGVLKALEENHIPIDYITGTSAGALIGGLYCAGYSPEQIERLVTSERFSLMSTGELEEEFKSYILQADQDAELVSYRFAKDSILSRLLPTKLLNASFLDFEMANMLGMLPNTENKSFDSLFIPFRCVASDITTKTSVLFKSGKLNEAVRASMTYPFFISPIEVDGKLLFDGGLYNNFPGSEMYQEFNADFIIGSNVSYNEPAPTRDDLMSQVRNMFSTHSDYSLPCDQGIIIEPSSDQIGTFDWNKIQEAIDIGYSTTLAKIDSIKMYVDRKVSDEEIRAKRQEFRKDVPVMSISDIEIHGSKDDQKNYYKRKLIRSRKEPTLSYEKLKKRYLHLYQSEHVESLFPNLESNSDSTQTLHLTVNRQKPLRLGFGGHYSSRPVNTGFLSVSYSDFKVTPLTVYANAYFGKFYGSVKTGIKLYLPTRLTTYIEPVFVRNRWDYFKSFATFFEDVRPSYLVHEETYWGLKFNTPLGSRGRFTIDFKNGENRYRYYQTEDFTNVDTADFTSLLFYSPGIEFTIDKLNRKQWASAGTKFTFKSRYVYGEEYVRPGSTSINKEESTIFRRWVYFTTSFKSFFMRRGVYRLGTYMEATYSFQPFFQNYTSSLLTAHAFQPTPDSQTGFYNDFRSNKYAGGGLINIFTIKDKVDIRLEAYIFQPLYRINLVDDEVVEGNLLEDRFGIASASVIYHSVIGPIRATAQFIQSQSILEPFSFQISYGYVLFNEKALK